MSTGRTGERHIADVRTDIGLLHHAARDHTPPFAPNRRHGHCLMHVQPHILRVPFHESRPLLWSMVVSQLHGTSRGRAFKLC